MLVSVELLAFHCILEQNIYNAQCETFEQILSDLENMSYGLNAVHIPSERYNDSTRPVGHVF